MTQLYDYRGIGPTLDVRCPNCKEQARFCAPGNATLPARWESNPNELSWRGRATCLSCGLNASHDLQWPNDAYFQIVYKSELLWAENYAMPKDMLSFIAAGDQRKQIRKQSEFLTKLVKIPKIFLSAKAREPITRDLSKLIASYKENTEPS